MTSNAWSRKRKWDLLKATQSSHARSWLTCLTHLAILCQKIWAQTSSPLLHASIILVMELPRANLAQLFTAAVAVIILQIQLNRWVMRASQKGENPKTKKCGRWWKLSGTNHPFSKPREKSKSCQAWVLQPTALSKWRSSRRMWSKSSLAQSSKTPRTHSSWHEE